MKVPATTYQFDTRALMFRDENTIKIQQAKEDFRVLLDSIVPDVGWGAIGYTKTIDYENGVYYRFYDTSRLLKEQADLLYRELLKVGFIGPKEYSKHGAVNYITGDPYTNYNKRMYKIDPPFEFEVILTYTKEGELPGPNCKIVENITRSIACEVPSHD